MLNLQKRLEFCAGLKPNQLAFVEGKNEIKFAELHVHALKITSVLKDFGIKRGDLVCTILPGFLDWPITLALSIIGATSFSRPGSESFSSDVDPHWLLTQKEHPLFPTNQTLLIDQAFAERVNQAEIYVSDDETSTASDLIRLYSTSGTTGEAKYVGFNESDLKSRFMSPSTVTFVGNGKFLNFFPMGAYQSHNWMLKSLFEGKTYFSASPKDLHTIKIIDDNNIKSVIGSPQHIQRFLETLKSKNIKLNSDFNIIMGGSSPNVKLLNRIRTEHSCSIYDALASTETGFIAVSNITTEDSPGLLLHPNSIVDVVDESGNLIDSEEVGVLRYKIPHAATSYINSPEATKEYFKNGYFYSGDMGYKTKGGRLFITGRSNEVINLGGVKVNPEQVDRIAIEERGVQDTAAFALEDETGMPKLAIALVTDSDFNEDVFRENMKNNFRGAKLEAIFQISAIPRNPNGKVLRRELSMKFSESL
jgi:acyl-coenzyme A synthetase/AMP-(fatty) acid ligase